MKTFEVEITETLQRTIKVQANSQSDAVNQVRDDWKNSKYVLDADNFVDVDFSAVPEEKELDYER